jgi:Tfp pilus assembly protein PilN
MCADLQNGQQHLHEGNAQQPHAAQLRELQAAHEEQVSSIQQAAQQSQADLQAAHAVESRIMQEAHAADMEQLQELREALPQAITQASSEARHPQDLSTSEIGTVQPTDRPWCSLRTQCQHWSFTDLATILLWSAS